MAMTMGLQRAIPRVNKFTFRWSLVVEEARSPEKEVGFTTVHVLGPTADCCLYLLSPASLTKTCAFAKDSEIA